MLLLTGIMLAGLSIGLSEYLYNREEYDEAERLHKMHMIQDEINDLNGKLAALKGEC